MYFTDNIIKAVSQPLCLVTISSKQITFVNPAMGKLFGIVTNSNELTNQLMFNDYFSFVDVTWDKFSENMPHVFDEHPFLIKFLKQQSRSYKYFYGHFSHLDSGTIILVLTPCLLSNSIVENPFLRNHENVVDVIENAPLAIHIKHITGEFIWTNKFEQELLGYKNDELVERNIKEVIIMFIFLYLYQLKAF